MSKHTPGPWSADDLGCMIHAAPNPYGKGAMRIADIRGWGHLTAKGSGGCGMDENTAIAIQVANASLIAAAPDLLAALEDALSGWQYVRKVHGDLPGVGWDRVETAARAVIAKAKGESNEP